MPPRLEVERVVAVVQVRELGEEVQVVLRVKLRVCVQSVVSGVKGRGNGRTFLDVREEGLEIIHEVPHAMRDAPRGEEEDPLLVLQLLRCGGLGLFFVYVHNLLRLPFSLALCISFGGICLLCLQK